ncbi:MAG: hypothetical protein K6F74_05300 [Prevotella sp.]|nr:hypothetical protein [Prevotella sp.]
MNNEMTLDETILNELKGIKRCWEKEVVRLTGKLNEAKEQIAKNERLITVFEERVKGGNQ